MPNDQPAATGSGLVAYPEAFGFHIWIVSQVESHEIEGQHETAERLRELDQLLLDNPAGFEAYMKVRAAS